MARDGRNNSKIRDLEGENRLLRKQLKHANKTNARLQKLLDRIESGNIQKNEINEIEEELEEVLDILDEGEKNPPPKGSIICELCGKTANKVPLTDIKGNNRVYIICSDKNCLHRKKYEK